nr:hypothetical protein [Tanacetum cinerariifolium]
MWEAIERLQQGESLNIQDVKTNLFWGFGKFTSHDGETMESYYTRFYKLMNEMIQNNLTVATMQVNVQFLKQLQPEWSRLARNANPLALVATAQANQDPYYQTSKSHKSYAPSSKLSIPTRSHTTTKHKGKEIAKLITPPSETASEEDNNPEQAQRDKDMQKNLDLIAKYFKKIYKTTNNNLRTSSKSRNKNVDTTPRYKNDNQSGQFGNQRTVNVAGARENVGSPVVQHPGIQCFNCKEFIHFAKECRKPKRVKDFAYHKEKMLSYKQAEQVEQVQNSAEYNVFANDLQHSEQSESVKSDDERVALANLIANIKLNVDENKKIQKQLKKANTTLAQDLKECKAILVETSKSLRESISVRGSCLVALQNKQTEFENYKAFNDRTIDYDKHEHALAELQCLYLHKVKESDCLAQKLSKQTESVSKEVHTELLKRFAKVENIQFLLKLLCKNVKNRILNANAVCATCKKCLVDSNHFACVTKMLNDVNARTKKHTVVPISTRKPKSQANKSVATHHKKKVVSKSTNQKAQSYFRMLYEKTSKTWKWWIEQQSLSGYKWVPKTKIQWVPKAKNDHVQKRIVQLILFIVDSGCTKHMAGNLKLLCNFVEKFMGLNHNLFSAGQFCDANLEVAFRKSTCFVRDLQGNELLTGNRGSDLYIISLQDSTSSTPLCLMAKALPTQAWLWHRRLSHLNFDYINLLSQKDIVIGLPKLKY